jgi:mono/diheme cytochrome c family protein
MVPKAARALVATLLIASPVPMNLASGQDRSPSSVWDGLYTQAQAERGEAAYRQACASCHGDTLEGQGQTPSLVGADFVSNWNGMPVGDLFDKIQTTMPADRPGQLSKEQNAQILAYILKSNKFPNGSQDLPAGGDALTGIRFEAQKGGK